MFDHFPLGAHLVTRRLGYLHHGIYAGNGRVIQYTGYLRKFPKGIIEEITLERFAKGRSVRVAQWNTPKFSGEARVERARARIGERHYRLLSNNCEHFAQWCVSDMSLSSQIETWKSRFHHPLTYLLAVVMHARHAFSLKFTSPT